MSKPTVSVVIPTYNREKSICRAVRSVLNQEGDGELFEIIEVLVIDDGSTDGTEAVIKELDDPRVRYHRMAENRGVSKARNTGAGMATGEWIAFQDSDDEWTLDKTRKQILLANQHPEYALIYTGMKVREKDGSESLFCPEHSGKIFQKLAIRNYIGAPTILIKSETWKESGGFDAQLPALEDWDFALRLSVNHELGAVAEPLLICYKGDEGISSNVANHYIARCMMIAKNKKDLLEQDCFQSATEALLNQAANAGILNRVGALLESCLRA